MFYPQGRQPLRTTSGSISVSGNKVIEPRLAALICAFLRLPLPSTSAQQQFEFFFPPDKLCQPARVQCVKAAFDGCWS
jgi:hypothetical protein